MSKARTIRGVLLVLMPLAVLAAGVAGFLALESLKKPPPRRPTKEAAPIVRAIRIEPRRLRLPIRGYGTSRPVRELSVMPEVGGKVTDVSPRLKVGAYLGAGELLLEIDPTDYRLARDRAQADVDRIKAQIQMLKQEKLNSERQVGVMRENLDLAQQDMKRLESLAKAGNASTKERDDARRVYLQQKNSLVTYENQVALMPTRIGEAQAQLKASEAQLDQANADLKRTKILVPFAARVIESSVEKNQVVQKGQKVAVLADTTTTEVPVVVEPERMRDLDLPHQGAPELRRRGLAIPAEVRWVAFGGRFKWAGKLVRLEPLDPQTRTVGMVVEVSEPWEGVKPGVRPPFLSGMYCEVSIQGVLLDKAIVIPRSALREGGIVYVAADGRLAFRKVGIRARLRDELVIQNDLTPGELVVVSPISYPVEGMKLRVKEVPARSGSRESSGQVAP